MKVLIKAPTDTRTAYGVGGTSIALALVQAGADVYLDPMGVEPPIPADVAELLTKPPRPPYDLLIHHDRPNRLGITAQQREQAAVTVAWTGWEYTTLDNCHGRSSLRRRLRDYDLTVGYDTAVTEALKPYVAGEQATVQGGYWPRHWPGMQRNANIRALHVCIVSNPLFGLNPFPPLQAFKEVREERPDLDIRLSIKTDDDCGLDPSRLHDLIPGLWIINERWTDSTLRGFYADQHVMVSTRSELQDRPALEFASTGGAVIGTNFGGHAQWLSASIGYPLEHHLVPVTRVQPGCCYAAPSTEHLKALLVHAAENRDELARKGTAAAELLPDMCSWPVVVDRLMSHVGRRKSFGHQILHSYRSDKDKMQESRQAVALL